MLHNHFFWMDMAHLFAPCLHSVDEVHSWVCFVFLQSRPPPPSCFTPKRISFHSPALQIVCHEGVRRRRRRRLITTRRGLHCASVCVALARQSLAGAWLPAQQCHFGNHQPARASLLIILQTNAVLSPDRNAESSTVLYRVYALTAGQVPGGVWSPWAPPEGL